MALMDKFLNYMRLNDEESEEFYDEEDEYFDEEDEYEEETVTPVKKAVNSSRNFTETYEAPVAPQPSKVTPLRPQPTPTRRSSSSTGMEVCVIKPVSIEDAKEITDTLRAGRAVVLNLEGLDVEVAQRIIDFASGSSYAIDGKLQKISHYIFILTPKTVDISGDFQDVISSSFEAPGTSIKNPLR